MTDANQRTPTLALPHGYRKLTGAVGINLIGEAAGQDALKYAWDSIILVLNNWLAIPLAPMPEKVAAEIFALLAMAVFYQMEEK